MEFCEDVIGQSVGEGTIVDASQQTAQAVEPVNERVKEYLIKTDEPVHFDESSLRVNRDNYWVHSAGTERATNYHIQQGGDWDRQCRYPAPPHREKCPR